MAIARLKLAAAAILASVPLAGCAYDMYGDPYGYGYGPYSSVSVGVGYGGGYGSYGYGYPYGGYGYGYPYGSSYGGFGYDPFGWYGNYYYPGAGIYVYDRSRTRHVWSDDQRRYWEQRRHQWGDRGGTGSMTSGGANWSGWDRSRWSGHGGTSATSVGSVPTTTWNRGSDYRGGGWRSRSSATGGERSHSWSGDRSSHGHSRERSNERPD